MDFPLFQRLALPIQVGTVKFPGIKIQDTRMIRLMEVFLHGGTRLAGWRATQIHQAILTSFHLSANRYGLPQLRYDLRKMKAHDLVQRDGHHYTYRLTNKGVKGRSSPLSKNASAGPSPIVSFTTGPTPRLTPKFHWKLLITRPMTPSKKSFSC